MRVIFKKVLGTRTLNVEEVIKVALSKDERAIYCLSADNETAIKFVAGRNIPNPIIFKAFHDLVTLGHYNFTKWDTYTSYYVEENNEEGWLLISRFNKKFFKEVKTS